MSLTAKSVLVGGDQVYRPQEGLAVYVVDVVHGYVVFDAYTGTTRDKERHRMPRATFNALFTNYSYKGNPE